MAAGALLEWYEEVRRPLPWRFTRDPWAILVSEVMLQQTQAARVVPHYERFLARFPAPRALADATAGEAIAAWSGLGYNRRALALREAARVAADDGWPPPSRLESLPGVGPYTAAALGSFAWDAPMAAVDTNVRRVIERRDGVRRGPRALARRAAELLPAGRAAAWNQAMMELGATICRPRRPDCGACPLRRGCAGPAALPAAPRAAAASASRPRTAGRAGGCSPRSWRAERRRRSTGRGVSGRWRGSSATASWYGGRTASRDCREAEVAVRRVSLTLRADAVEEVLDVLLPRLPQGVYERALDTERTEVAFYGEGAPAGAELDALAGAALLGRDEQEVPDGREERRRRATRAWEVAGRLRVRGPHDPPGEGGLPELVIEPGAGAFGTGAHPTTRMSLALLLEAEPGGGFADLGCGAGVLAVAAARLGWEPVLAVDVEPRSVEATARNAERNGVAVQALHADLLEVPPPPAGTLAANVPAAVHERIAGGLSADTRLVIASGLVDQQVATVRERYATAGLAERARRSERGWAALALERP